MYILYKDYEFHCSNYSNLWPQTAVVCVFFQVRL